MMQLLRDNELPTSGRVRRASADEILPLLSAELRNISSRFEKTMSIDDLAQMQEIILCLQEETCIPMKEVARSIRLIHKLKGGFKERWVLMKE